MHSFLRKRIGDMVCFIFPPIFITRPGEILTRPGEILFYYCVHLLVFYWVAKSVGGRPTILFN